jgi:xanthine dehydrogenase YagS FAD-binding subunit
MRSFKHIDVKTIDEACAALSSYHGRSRLNAGGTDLLLILKGDILPDYPKALINIKTIPHLDYIKRERQVLKIGALACLSDIARSPLVNKEYGVLAKAALSVASPQIRNVATLGGNLCQDVRCWYYRYPRHIGGPVMCLRKRSGTCLAVKGDNRYHAIMGGRKCFAVCPSDTAIALAALDARMTIASPQGERNIEVIDFYGPLGNALKKDEMIREIEIPIRKVPAQQTFLKFTLRKPIDFAIVSVASVITMEKGKCKDARIVLGAVASGPVRAKEAEETIIGQPVQEDIAIEVAEKALARAKPLSKNAYKIEIAKVLVKRAIMGDQESSHPAV